MFQFLVFKYFTTATCKLLALVRLLTLKFQRNLIPVSSDYKEEPYWLAALQLDYSTGKPFSLDVDAYFAEP
jgi:hypothetical protein